MLFKMLALAVGLVAGVFGYFIIAHLYYNIVYDKIYNFFYPSGTLWGNIIEAMRGNLELLLKGLPLLMVGIFIIMMMVLIFGSELESKRIEYRY